MDEKTLVELSRNGRTDAFEKLVRMYDRKIFALAYGFVRDRATADDLAQEIFLKAYQSLPSFRVESGFGTWIYRIAVNHVKDHLRKLRDAGLFPSTMSATARFPSTKKPASVSANARRKNGGKRFSGSWKHCRRNSGRFSPSGTWRGFPMRKSAGFSGSPRERSIPAFSAPGECFERKWSPILKPKEEGHELPPGGALSSRGL